MINCQMCGSPLINEDDQFCTHCGAKRQEPSTKRESTEAVFEEVDVVPAMDMDDVSTPTEGATSAQVTASSAEHAYYPESFPDTASQKAFSVVMIVVSGLLLCCSGLLALPFAIIALVQVLGAEKAQDVETANYKLKSALILNCVSIGILFIGIVILFVAQLLSTFFTFLG